MRSSKNRNIESPDDFDIIPFSIELARTIAVIKLRLVEQMWCCLLFEWVIMSMI